MFLVTTFLLLDKMHTKAYNVCMEKQRYTVLRVRRETHQLFRRIAAMSDESMVETLDRLAHQEWARIQKEQGKPDALVQKEQEAGS
jgi:hypothetical protein